MLFWLQFTHTPFGNNFFFSEQEKKKPTWEQKKLRKECKNNPHSHLLRVVLYIYIFFPHKTEIILSAIIFGFFHLTTYHRLFAIQYIFFSNMLLNDVI